MRFERCWLGRLLTRRSDPLDAAWLGLACGALVATGLGSDAGIKSLDQVLDFLERRTAGPQPAGSRSG